jgi:hypothetical protein
MSREFVLLSVLVFSVVTLFPWYIEKNNQIFNPMRIRSGLQVVMISPAAIILMLNPDMFVPEVLTFIAGREDLAISRALLMLALSNACVYASYYAVAGKLWRREAIATGAVRLTPLDSHLSMALLFVIGMSAYAYKIQQVGGFSFLVNNIAERTSLQAGLGPLNYLMDAAFTMLAIVAARRHAILGGFDRLIFVILIFLVVAVAETAFGGRKGTLQLAITLMFVYAICNPKYMKASINKLPILLLIVSVVLVYFFSVLAYRISPTFDEFVRTIPDLGASAMESLSESLISLSYLDTYVFVADFFNPDNYYLGSTFLDLRTSFFPSALFPDKPPVDDGFYVRIATLGGWLEPGTPAHSLRGIASWPPETMGAAYMNGGPLLVVISGLILGLLLAKGNQWALERPNSLLAILVVTTLSLDFELSNLRVVTFVSLVGACFILEALLKFLGLSARPLKVTSARV